MISRTTLARMEAMGVVVQSAEYVALAMLMLASNAEYHGQCWAVVGGRCREVEVELERLKPQWLGEWNMEQMRREAGVEISR
jgi:hypothetical protein